MSVILPELINTHSQKFVGHTTLGWSTYSSTWVATPYLKKKKTSGKSCVFGGEKVIWFWCFWPDGSCAGAGWYKVLLIMLLMGALNSFSLPPVIPGPIQLIAIFFPAHSLSDHSDHLYLSLSSMHLPVLTLLVIIWGWQPSHGSNWGVLIRTWHYKL